MSERHEKPLRAGTMKCPKDKIDLHWEQFQGMRIIRDGLLQARCPSCRKYWAVRSSN